MAKKSLITKLTDEEVLRIARLRVTETAAATYTQGSIDTQLSVERGVIWMIHFIEFQFGSVIGLAGVGANAVEDYKCQVTRESKEGMLQGSDADVIQQYRLQMIRSAAIGTDVGPLYSIVDLTRRFDYQVPIPYASQSLFASLVTTHTAAQVVDVRVGYTIKEVDDQFFFRVAQALLG